MWDSCTLLPPPHRCLLPSSQRTTAPDVISVSLTRCTRTGSILARPHVDEVLLRSLPRRRRERTLGRTRNVVFAPSLAKATLVPWAATSSPR